MEIDGNSDDDTIIICDMNRMPEPNGRVYSAISLSVPDSLIAIRDAVKHCLDSGNCVHCPVFSTYYNFVRITKQGW